MKGIPQVLNTQYDYMYLKEHFPSTIWKPAFTDLLTTTAEWFNTGEVTEGITDQTHKVVADSMTSKKYQYELRIIPNPKLEELGWTIKDVQKILEDEE